MDRARTLLVCTLSAATLACNGSEGDGERVQNLGVFASTYEFEGDLLVASVSEAFHDLNGDGDSSDAFIEIFDLVAHTSERLPLVALRGFELGAGYIAFTVNESGQGEDLNHDGDIAGDDVLHVHDTRTGTTRNLALAVLSHNGRVFVAQEGALIAFVVSEAAQGEDLDGDGELTHELTYAYRADLDALVALDLPSEARPVVEGERVFVAVPEDVRGDLNGDGDSSDWVLASFDTRTHTTQNLERAVSLFHETIVQFAVEGPLLVVRFHEEAQYVDQNGDGDLDDSFVELRDLDAGTILTTDLPVGHVSVGGGLAGLVVPERTFGDPLEVDRNGDGDTLDTVVYFYDWLTGTLVNTEAAIGWWNAFAVPPVYSARRSAFLVPAQGDRNGDGDTNDLELCLFDARTGRTEATGIVVRHQSGIDLDEGHLACAALGASELVPLVLDLTSGERTRLAGSLDRVQIADGRVLFSVHERVEGADLNGDGDTQDVVQRAHDLRSGQTFDTRLAVSPNDRFPTVIRSGNGRVAWNVPEESQGRDLDGDGVQFGWVLHVVELP